MPKVNESRDRAPISVIRTHIDPELIEYINKTLHKNNIVPDRKGTLHVGTTNESIRKCTLVPISSQHWFAGMIWHHIQRSNQSNFRLDIHSFEDDAVSLMQYEKGHHYTWHADTLYPGDTLTKARRWKPLDNEEIYVRKLSFSLPLTDPSEYTGGKLQFYVQGENRKIHTINQQLGQLIVFDSRVCHRVMPIKSGIRRALVGWVLGPLWK